jgi:hypothetical protein
MASKDFLQGAPDIMERFSPQAPQMDFSGVAAGGSGGGMTEAAGFVSTHEGVKNDFQAYIQSAVSGIQTYKGMAVQAATDYRKVNNDARARYSDLVSSADVAAEHTPNPVEEA